MGRGTQNHTDLNSDDADCHRLIEALADGNPIPDTSTICPDRQRLISLLAEINKGERSEFFQNIRQVVEQRGLPTHEIASRAAFLLACLDTPGADDPYALLGVASTATSEEIKEAWLSRLRLYHPDRHPENGDWFTRQAARLNEAYQILKDPARRHAYDDRKRRERLGRQQSGPLTIQDVSSVSPPLIPPQPIRLMRHRTPALITAISVAAAGLVTMALSGYLPTEPQLYLETPRPMTRVALSPTPPTRAPFRAGLTRDVSPSLEATVIPPPNQVSERRPVKRAPHASQPSVIPTGQHDSSHNPTAPTHSEADPLQLAQALPPIVSEPKSIERHEIDTLLDEYVDAYEKGEVDRLMATLSQNAREKGTLDYQAIRNAHIKGFTGRDQIIYRLKNLQVEIKGEQATVTAQYLISARNAAQSSKGTTISGRIEWKIKREGEKLRIVAINY